MRAASKLLSQELATQLLLLCCHLISRQQYGFVAGFTHRVFLTMRFKQGQYCHRRRRRCCCCSSSSRCCCCCCMQVCGIFKNCGRVEGCNRKSLQPRPLWGLGLLSPHVKFEPNCSQIEVKLGTESRGPRGAEAWMFHHNDDCQTVPHHHALTESWRQPPNPQRRKSE